MSFSVRKQKPERNVSIEEEILKSTDIKTEEDLKKFLSDVSKNGTKYRNTNTNTTKTTSGFTNRRSKNDEEL